MRKRTAMRKEAKDTETQDLLNIITRIARKCLRDDQHPQPREWSKKFVQQGRSNFDAWSVLLVREHDKMSRTPLATFFNIPAQGTGNGDYSCH